MTHMGQAGEPAVALLRTEPRGKQLIMNSDQLPIQSRRSELVRKRGVYSAPSFAGADLSIAVYRVSRYGAMACQT